MKRKMIKIVVLLMALATTNQNEVAAKPIHMVKVIDGPITDQDEVPHRVPAVIPGVDYTDNVLTFFSNVQILSMEVIVKDSNGNVIYDDYINITNGETAIELPDEVNANAWTVDIIYGSMHLSGYLY